jgi:huntingtin-interacting protein 1-related protein
MLNGGDPFDVVSASTAFAHVTSNILHNSKGVTRLAGEDDTSDKIIQFAKAAATRAKFLLSQLRSQAISSVDQSRRVEYVKGFVKDMAEKFGAVGSVVERLVTKDVRDAIALSDDLNDVVEREMLNAANAIKEAVNKLRGLLSRPQRGEGLQVQVNAAILDAALVITQAIASLIRQATAVQQEVVAVGRGGGTATAFYKTNSRWTEGLVSCRSELN